MLEVVVSGEGKVRTISLHGECDLQASPDLDELIRSSVEAGLSALRIDLRGLTFIDSTGLRCVVMAKSCVESAGMNFSIVPGPPSVMRVFEIVDLVEALPFEGQEAAAP